MKFPIRSIKAYDIRSAREIEWLHVIVGTEMFGFRVDESRDATLEIMRKEIKLRGCQIPAFKFFEAEDWPGTKVSMETLEVEP